MQPGSFGCFHVVPRRPKFRVFASPGLAPRQSDWSFMSRAGLFGSGLSGRVLAVLMVVFAAVLPVALAAPSLPSSTLAAQAVRSALAVKSATATSRASGAAATRARGVNTATAASVPRSTGRSALVHSTAYNSTPGQTDSTPYITATGTRVRSGVVALSRDLLGRFPYGTRISIEDMSGRYSSALRGRVFIVEDTMHPRIANTVDVWMGSRGEAMAWGARTIRITALR
jgi:3D (Asp-Asp-Asp) domain-containing protein